MRDRRYWDSDAFLGYLKAEEDKADSCQAVLDAGMRQELEIVTSALTLAEVLHVKGGSRLSPELREQIAEIFEQPFIHVINVTRRIAEIARDVYWDHGIEPKDAIHIATALFEQIPLFETFDKGLLKKDGIIAISDGGVPLQIKPPGTGVQRPLF